MKYKQVLFNKVLSNLDSGSTLMMVGPRRAGKTLHQYKQLLGKARPAVDEHLCLWLKAFFIFSVRGFKRNNYPELLTHLCVPQSPNCREC